ncbi:MAG TPA: hypothetical protein VLZ83_09010 [Edaphocola sp.]|nr:hypothetical protein [Edaphocola sp.]
MRFLAYILVSIFFLTACSKESKERVYTEQEAQQISDSFIKSKEKALNEQARKDLEYRKAIELRSRIDSIKNNNSEKE